MEGRDGQCVGNSICATCRVRFARERHFVESRRKNKHRPTLKNGVWSVRNQSHLRVAAKNSKRGQETGLPEQGPFRREKP